MKDTTNNTKEKKKIYLRNYYIENRELWKKGNKYHPKTSKSNIKGFSKINKKVVVSFN